MFSFGCVNNCHYCSAKERIKFRDVSQTADEIELLYHSGKRILWFADVNHFVSLDKLVMLNEELNKRKINIKKHALLDPWLTVTSPGKALEIIKRDNYIGLFFGRDAVTNKEAEMYGRTLGCNIRDVEKERDYFFDFIEKCVKIGVKPIISYIFAHPLNTLEETELKMKEVLKMHELGVRVSIYTHTPFPGTIARNQLKTFIRQEAIDDWNKYDIMFWPLYHYNDDRIEKWVTKSGNDFRKLVRYGYCGNAKLIAALLNLDQTKLDIPFDLKEELFKAQKIINQN